MVAWFYEHIISETVEWFCRVALPGNAGDWSRSLYNIVEIPPDEPSGHAYRIDIDIPFVEDGALPCWLTFTISSPAIGDEERAYVKHLSAVRGAIGAEPEGTYTWDDSADDWVKMPEGNQ